MSVEKLESLVEEARGGDARALEEVVRAVQDRIYGLSMRMLAHPEDARDATQEILVKIVTNLSGFRGESAFTTWVYRIAANHLFSARKHRAGRAEITFEQMEQKIDAGLSGLSGLLEAEVLDRSHEPTAEDRLLVEEVKVRCTQGMLLCLDREHRIAYVLGEIFGVSGSEGAEILGITPAAFRKRLSRARERVRRFMWDKCGLVDPSNPCRCSRQVPAYKRHGGLHPDRMLFANHPRRSGQDEDTPFAPSAPHEAQKGVRELEEMDRAAAVFRSHPDYATPETFVEGIRRLLFSERYGVLKP